MKAFSIGFALFYLAGIVCAELPPGSIILEPETMQVTGDGWGVRTNFDGWFKGGTTGGQCLYGAEPGGGQATQTLTCPADGKYRLWVRYLDLGKEPRGSKTNAFIVTTLQPPAAPSQKTFDLVGMRLNQAGLEKWGDSWAAFVWDSMDVDLKQGPFQVVIAKTHPHRTELHQRLVDCMILTTNLHYEPMIEDLTPLYVQFNVLESNPQPLRFGMRCRRPDGSDFWPADSASTPLVKQVEPGAASEWIPIYKYLKGGRKGQKNRVTLYCFREHCWARGIRESSYTVHFSRTPSLEGLVFTQKREGPGDSVSFLIDLLTPEGITSEIGESAANLARSLATPAIGKYPQKIVFSTGCDVGGGMAETFTNEMQTLHNIGINQIAFSPGSSAKYMGQGFTRAEVSFYLWNLAQPVKGGPAGACFLNPDLATIESEAEKAEQRARQYPEGVQVVRLADFADEPMWDHLGHVTKCPKCQEAFNGYLQAQHVSIDDLKREWAVSNPGVVVPDVVRPSAATNTPMLFYWTSRFGLNTFTEFVRLGTQVLEKQSPLWRTTMNFADLRSSLAGLGLDWFELFRTGALNYGLNEDYIAFAKNFQIRGYAMAVMRAACKTRGHDFGPLVTYPGNTGWQVVAGGFSQIGQGARRLSFFSYGPHYKSVPSPYSANQWVHDSTRHLAYATGAVEDDLVKARVMPGDVAMLYSMTCDIWNHRLGANMAFSNLYGMERTYLYLLLRHLQASVDILAEEDLATDLKNHKMLMVADSHLRREHAGAIQAWVHAGGTLYIGANALAFDEYNRPLGLIEALGIKRGALMVDGNLYPGRPEFELTHRKSLGKVKTAEAFNALFGTQHLEGGETLFSAGDGQAAMVVAKYGKGQVIAAYTFPAMEYIKTSDWDKALPIYSTVKFQSGPREFIGKALERGGVAPRAVCNNMLLEANLLENGRRIVVALANWSGAEQEAEIAFRGLGRVGNVTAVRSKIRITEQTADRLVVAGRFGAGDFLTIERKGAGR